jgi:protein TonB
MDATKILAADILDILFDGKNKDYGAYELRKNYERRLKGAILITVAVVVVLTIGYYLSKTDTKLATPFVIRDDTLTKIAEPHREVIIQQRIIQPRMAISRYNIPRIVPDKQAQKNEMPPDSALEQTKIGNINQAGLKDDGLTGPSEEVKKGIVGTPKQDIEMNEFIPIENESQYPGGMDAWQRFLNKNLKYPEEAVAIGIEGDIIVQFLVDKEGNISEIDAISGPSELRDEAVRVIKKSGRWTPAVQNGLHVKSYKKQPIKFRLESQ